MTTDHKHGILIAVDASKAVERALRHVAHMIGGRSDFRVRLLHLLPPLPADLLEHGGSEDPAVEKTLDEGLHERRERWIETKKKGAEAVFERAKSILRDAVAPESVEAETRISVDTVPVAKECVAAAREAGCKTIAVGRESLPWYREPFHRHACDDVVKHAEGFAVRVVEWDV